MGKKANRRVSSEKASRRLKERPSRKGGRRNGLSLFSSRKKSRHTSKATPEQQKERKIRNRTLLVLAVLGMVNAYIFFGKDNGSFSEFSAKPAVISGAPHSDPGPLGTYADPPEQACGSDPVRVFAGLHKLHFLETSLSKGRTLRLALLSLGFAGGEIDALEAAIRPAVDLSILAGNGAPVRVAMDRGGNVVALEVELSEGHLLQACRQKEHSFAVRNIQHPLMTEAAAVGLTLGPHADLQLAVADAHEQPELATNIAQVLAFDMDFMTEARPGDQIQVIVEKRFLGPRFHRYGPILAVRYIGAAGKFAYYRYQAKTQDPGYFSSDGKPMRRSFLRSPIAYHEVPVEARGLLAPTIEVVTGKVGATYVRPEGAPVVALADGVVRVAENAGDSGNIIEVVFADGVVARYSHLLSIVGGVQVGSEVRQGQLIGMVGHSGKTAHNRLRLELWQEKEGNITSLDPLLMTAEEDKRVQRMGEAIPEDIKKRFQADVKMRRQALLQAQ